MLVVPHHIEQTKSYRNSAVFENRYLWFDYSFISGSENVAPSKKRPKTPKGLESVVSFSRAVGASLPLYQNWHSAR